MTIETDGKKTTVTKTKGNLFTLKLLRVPTGVQLHFDSAILSEYFKSVCYGKEGACVLSVWKTLEGESMPFNQIETSRLPSDLTGGLCFNKPDKQLFNQGYANLSWIGCNYNPVLIQGVYTQKTIDKYCLQFTDFARKVYLNVLKPYSRQVTITYDMESEGGL